MDFKQFKSLKAALTKSVAKGKKIKKCKKKAVPKKSRSKS
jgi:hypothetical protein